MMAFGWRPNNVWRLEHATIATYMLFENSLYNIGVQYERISVV